MEEDIVAGKSLQIDLNRIFRHLQAINIFSPKSLCLFYFWYNFCFCFLFFCSSLLLALLVPFLFILFPNFIFHLSLFSRLVVVANLFRLIKSAITFLLEENRGFDTVLACEYKKKKKSTNFQIARSKFRDENINQNYYESY